MKSLQKIWFLFVVALLLVAMTPGSGNYVNHSLTAEPIDGTFGVVVQWEVKNPALVNSFLLERTIKNGSQGSNGTKTLNQSCIRRVGSSNVFQCKDSDLYKDLNGETSSTEHVSYRLSAQHTDGKTYFYDEASTEFTTNAVRRTWGSIKAMFQ